MLSFQDMREQIAVKLAAFSQFSQISETSSFIKTIYLLKSVWQYSRLFRKLTDIATNPYDKRMCWGSTFRGGQKTERINFGLGFGPNGSASNIFLLVYRKTPKIGKD